jgi:KDEL-tailed cysteine endopeptidase
MRSLLVVALAAATHYEKPPCGSDEVEGQIGQGGIACLPACDMSTSCPTDVPSGVTAKPECALQDASSSKMYCGLICHEDSQCGEAKCQILQGNIGICTYAQGKPGERPAVTYQPYFTKESHTSAFKDFITKFEKTYKTAEEYAMRFAIFVENRIYVHRMNMDKDQTATFALNEFADLTWQEFRGTYVGGFKPSIEKRWEGLRHLGTHKYSGAELPSEVDWTTKGAVTPVKNQGQCGSCWAFSTTGSLEGAWQIANGKLVSISEQQLVDCSKAEGNMGCGGGLMDNGFKYAKENAMCTEESYPYTAKNGKCTASSCSAGIPEGSVTGYQDVATDDEQALMEAVSKGPVSIAIEADHQAFQFYHGGVLKKACGTQLDHGVLLVGYGEKDGVKFWKVKNSWGGSWGEQGYIELERENSPDGKAGECGLLSQPSYPVVKSGPTPPSPTPPSPTPPSPSPPSPTPPSPSPSSHYEKPPCQSDEVQATVQGLDAPLCVPKCDAQGECPSDKPADVVAPAKCMLQTQSGDKYCALECFADVMCGTGKCGKIGGIIGVCYYPGSEHVEGVTMGLQETKNNDLVV